MKSVMTHQFSRVPQISVPRSVFDRSHGYKTTFDAGYLVPIFVDEALPGDSFNMNMSIFGRLATPIAPIMDNLILETFFFAVPIRLIWDNWEKFNGAQDDPGDSTDYLVPQMPSTPTTGYAVNSLHDYFGLPTGISTSYDHNSLHHRAYNLIWNEWFRDQNLQDSVVVDKDDGPDSPSDYVLLKRGKRHDYFTSCLPWPQKGDAVNLPLGIDAPVTGIGAKNTNYSAGPQSAYETDGSGASTWGDYKVIGTSGDDLVFYVEEDPDNAGYPNIRADLSAATAATINQLRQAFQIQKMYEKDARGGTRYVEVIKAHFGVTSPDYRLQRPEFLGSGRSYININPVTQTGESGSTPQGNMAAFGTVSGTNHGFTKSFTEHCVLLGLANIRADLSYMEGLERMWSRQTRFDFYWPSLAHLGEQAVLNKEIYLDGSSNDEDVFGYQERYAEYRYKASKITGLFRSQAASTLDYWHLAQEFGSLPTLNSTFIQDDPPIDRAIATPTEPHLIFDSYTSMKVARPMPLYSVPGLIDHF